MVILLLLIIVYGMFRTSTFQTFISQKIASNFAERLNTVITIQGVDIAFFNSLILEGLYVEDMHGDTLLYIPKLAIGLDKYDLDAQNLSLDEIVLNDGVLCIRKYAGEEHLNFQFIIDAFDNSDTAKANWEINIGTTDIRDMRFVYVDENKERSESLIDFQNLRLESFSTYIVDTRIAGDSIIGEIQSMMLREQSGFIVSNLSGKIKTSTSKLDAANLMVQTPMSRINGNVKFSYSGYSDYKYFIDSIRIQAQFEETTVNLKDLSYFVSDFKGLNDPVTFNGGIRGSVSKLKGKNIDITYGEDTRFQGNLSMNGLPNFEETFIRFRVKEFSTSQRDLARLPVPPFGSGKTWEVPPYVKNLGNFSFIGDFTGFYNDFVAYGNFKSGLGRLRSDLSLSYNQSIKMVHYEGQVSSSAFDIGQMFDVQDDIGVAAFDINITGDGLNKNTAKAELDGIVKGVTLKDYYYQNVELKGELENRRFSGYMAARDENLNFVFNGEIDYSSSPPKFIFTADIAGANLDKLNLTTTLESPVFSVRVESNFSGRSIDDIQGEIHLKDLKYRDAKLQSDEDFYPIGDISLIASENMGKRNMQLNSEFAEVEVQGIFNMRGLEGALIHSLQDLLPNSEHLAKLVHDTRTHKHDQDFEYTILIKDVDEVLSIFNDELRIAPGSQLKGVFDSRANNFKARLESQKINLGAVTFNEVELDVKLLPLSDSVMNGRPVMELHSLAHFGSVVPKGRWSLSDVGVSIDGSTNALLFSTSWDNEELPLSKGSIIGDLQFTKGKVNNEIVMKLQPTEITLADTLWTISGGNKVRYNANFLGITGLNISNTIQEFKVDGSNSRDGDDGIKVALSNFEVAAFEPLIANDKLRVDGMVSGEATIYGLFSKPYATGNVQVKDLTLNEELLGDASFNSSWKAGSETVSVSGSIVKGTLEVFSVLGNYHVAGAGATAGTFDSDITFTKFGLRPFQSLAANVFSEISPSTTVSGSLTLSGSGIQPVLLGKLNVQRGGFRLANLNTEYTLADEFVFTDNAISFVETAINDMKGNRAIATGKIMHEYFRNWSLDLSIRAENIHSLNTDLELNNLYYGQAFATGDISITGPFDNISIDIAATTGKNTQLHIPLTAGEELNETSYITFINGNLPDTIEVSPDEKVVKPINFPQINMNIEATEYAEVQVIFDETVGDVLKASGRGDLQFKVDRDGSFNMYGTYEIRKGDYLFTLSGIINKRFKIEPGGTIAWNGSPYDAILDLNAIYSVSTSLYNLTGMDKDKRRVRVECHLRMAGALMNPDIVFDIVFPELDASSSDVAWLFNTDQQINRQVFSLLVLGQFQPSAVGDAGVSGSVRDNPSELLSNQLSNWLSQISEDFDIGVNYRSGDEITEKELEVALSTQLFNDRLRVDGSVANNANSAAQNSSNIVGDFSLEYMLTKEGDLSLKAYNRANNSYLSTTAAPYKQGVGLAYKKEFSSWRQLFGKMRKNKNESLEKE